MQGTQHCRQKPTHKKPNGGGYAAVQTLAIIKLHKINIYVTQNSDQSSETHKF